MDNFNCLGEVILLKPVKRTILCFVIMIMILVSTGCGGRSATNFKGDAGKIRVMLFDRGSIPSGEGTLTDNRWINFLKEEAKNQGIEVEYIPVPRNQSTEKVITMMGANNAPDIFYLYEREFFLKFASLGGLLDYSDLLETYGENVLKLYEGKDILKYGKVDGRQYGIPSIRQDRKHYGAFIRKDWLDILDIEPPTDKESLVTVLKAFRDEDPGNVGDKLIPMQIPFDSTAFTDANRTTDLMRSFLSTSIEEEKTMLPVFRPGFKEYMAYLNKLYREDLIHKEFPTFSYAKNREQVMQGIVGFFNDNATLVGTEGFYGTLKKNVPTAELLPLEVYDHDDGSYYKLEHPPFGFYLMTPKSSKSPESVVKYIDLLCREDIAWKLSFGIEGEHYTLDDYGAPIPIDFEYNSKTLDYTGEDLRLIARPEMMLNADAKRSLDESKAEMDPYREFNKMVDELGKRDAVQPFVQLTEIKTISRYMPQLIKLSDQYWVKLITAEDFDSMYEEFIVQLNKNGADKIIEEMKDLGGK